MSKVFKQIYEEVADGMSIEEEYGVKHISEITVSKRDHPEIHTAIKHLQGKWGHLVDIEKGRAGYVHAHYPDGHPKSEEAEKHIEAHLKQHGYEVWDDNYDGYNKEVIYHRPSEATKKRHAYFDKKAREARARGH